MLADNSYPLGLLTQLLFRESDGRRDIGGVPAVAGQGMDLTTFTGHLSLMDDNQVPDDTNGIQNDNTAKTWNHNITHRVRYLRLPYIEGLTMNTASVLSTHFNDMKPVYYSDFTIKKHYSRVEDPTPTLKQPEVVYQIPCQSCNLVYILKSPFLQNSLY